MIEFKVDSNIEYLNFDYDLKTVAQAVKKDIEENLTTVRSYDGSAIAPLKPSYAKMKLAKLGSEAIFDGFRKGSKKLINSIRTKKISDYEYEVFVTDANNNSNIMKYLQEGKKPLAGARRAFGIGKAGAQRVARVIEEALKIKYGR